jgi:hypothetical protein
MPNPWKNYKCNNTDIKVKGRSFNEAAKNTAIVINEILDNLDEDRFTVRKDALQGAWKTFSVEGVEVNARNFSEASNRIVPKLIALRNAVAEAPESCLTQIRRGRPRKPKSNIL